ncbi:MAG: MATE family efflux transporter [Candidatus Thermoplasmatota archaeon]
MTSSQTDLPQNATYPETHGVKTLLGDPKKAILKLSIPMIVAMVVQTLYTLMDTIWVSGLGPDALAAVGFVFPFIFMGMALATGIGIGGGSAISRKIGQGDKAGADLVALHTLIISLAIAVCFSVLFFLFPEPIFFILGAGEVTVLAAIYARIIALGTIITFFTLIATAVLRSEGDAQRSMYAMVLGGILNAVLDPIFIYTFGLGVAGAAWATLLSMAVSAVLLFYWLFLKKDTYISLSFKGFHFQKDVVWDIVQVGFPASVMQLSMAIMMIIINSILTFVGGTDGVAVFRAGWSIVTIATMPLLGMATAVVSVSGAMFGAQSYVKVNEAYIYAIKLGVVLEIILAAATVVLAPHIALLFTFSADAARLTDGITNFLHIIFIFYPASAFGIFSSAVFQGMGKGFNSLLVTLIRTIFLVAPLAWIFSTMITYDITGVWWGLVTGNCIAAVIGFVWARQSIHRLINRQQMNTTAS